MKPLIDSAIALISVLCIFIVIAVIGFLSNIHKLWGNNENNNKTNKKDA